MKTCLLAGEAEDAAAPSKEHDDEEEEELPSARRRRRSARSRAASVEELRERFAWLSGLKPEDKPWIYFALHRAHHSRVNSDLRPPSVCSFNASKRNLSCWELILQSSTQDSVRDE